MSPFPAKQARPKTYREGLNANLEQLGNNKMAKLVKNNSRSEDEYESQQVD